MRDSNKVILYLFAITALTRLRAHSYVFAKCWIIYMSIDSDSRIVRSLRISLGLSFSFSLKFLSSSLSSLSLSTSLSLYAFSFFLSTCSISSLAFSFPRSNPVLKWQVLKIPRDRARRTSRAAFGSHSDRSLPLLSISFFSSLFFSLSILSDAY